MTYDVYASPVPVPGAHRDKMIGLGFATPAEALERASHLRRAGWFVYRISGPDGFDMTEQDIARYCDARPKGGQLGKSRE